MILSYENIEHIAVGVSNACDRVKANSMSAVS